MRDNYTCQYCGFRSEKYQIVHHVDGNPENNYEQNLTVICQMCNLIEHSGQGCVVQAVVDLYAQSKFNQNEIIQIARRMRAEGKRDDEIIKYFGLRVKMPFKMDRKYLAKLYGFVTSRRSLLEDDMYNHWLDYEAQTRNRSAE